MQISEPPFTPFKAHCPTYLIWRNASTQKQRVPSSPTVQTLVELPHDARKLFANWVFGETLSDSPDDRNALRPKTMASAKSYLEDRGRRTRLWNILSCAHSHHPRALVGPFVDARLVPQCTDCEDFWQCLGSTRIFKLEHKVLILER